MSLGGKVALTLGRGVDGRARLAGEAVLALLTAGEGAALLLEVGHGDSGERGRAVVLSGVVVDLVDGDGGVGDVRLNGLCSDN